ncbi:hypothetical protein pb186bvf_015954 [Paramecium bursaria]
MKVNQLQRDDDGNLIMNESNIIKICNQEGLYEYPDLNTKLYLHFKGIILIKQAFKKIGGLDSFTNVKVLWLENNFITKIEGLDKLTKLTHLFLQNNLIQEIRGLDNNLELHTINLSSNSIRLIQNISHLQNLSTLEIGSNKLQRIKDIEQLQDNISINTLNLENNYLIYENDEDPLLQILVKIQDLKCVYLMNNEYIRSIVNYRKVNRSYNQKYISQLPNLTYLDTQPVVPNERRLAEAWGKGGQQGEKDEREKIKQEEMEYKQQERQRVRDTLPKNLENKIIFFQKSIEQLKNEIIELEEIKIKQINQGYGEGQIEFMDKQIEKKQLDIQELDELLQVNQILIDIIK